MTTKSASEALVRIEGATTRYSADGEFFVQGSKADDVVVSLERATVDDAGDSWWATVTLATGSHEIELVATDSSGAEERTAFTFVVDPTLTRAFAYITDLSVADDGSITVIADYAQFLSGEEANEAARAAGEIGEDETVPNDYYISNENDRLRELSVATEAPIVLQACFVDGPCIGQESVSHEHWLALVAGEQPTGLPEGFQWYGQGGLPYWVTLDSDEAVVQIEEQYLP